MTTPASHPLAEMMDNLGIVALGGLLVLVALATSIGVADGRARRSAWNRIAGSRRRLSEHRDSLAERESDLDIRQEALDRRERRVSARERALSEQERSARDPDVA